MRNLKRVVIAGLLLAALPAMAEPPDDIVGLLGASVPSAELKMQQHGYAQAGGTHWWNAKTGVCVTVGVANGHFSTIDTVAARDCGLKAVGESGAASARQPSREAMDACMDSADQMMEEPDGTSTVKHYEHSGENWVMTMHTAGQMSHCTVTQAGQIVTMTP